jgi:NAD-dependent SIR2 family protein deacetylase
MIQPICPNATETYDFRTDLSFEHITCPSITCGLRQTPTCEKDRVTSKQKAPTRCPECHRALRPTIMSRTKITIPTQWLEEHIRKTVEDMLMRYPK